MGYNLNFNIRRNDFFLVASIGFPLILAILAHKKAQAKIPSFFIGCGIFIVFALILEQLMHSAVLSVTGTLLTGNVILYALYGGLAAALFEETGRLTAMKFLMKKNLNRENALMYGIGHGGIEAIILVGFTYINNLITATMINSGAIQGTLSALDESLRLATFQQLRVLWELPSWHFYMAGIERIMAVILHISLSVLVYSAVKTGKYRFWLLAFSLHFVVNFVTATINGFGAPIWFVEIILLVMVAAAALYAFKQYKADSALPQVL